MAGLNAYTYGFLKSFTPQAAAAVTSLWTIAGIPGPGVNASSGTGGDVPTDATAGAFPFSNSNNTYLARLGVWCTQIGHLMLYDRLWHNSGLSVTSTSGQTVNSSTLTRPNSNGDGVEAWLQVYTTLGAGSTAKTISYTNQSGTSGQTGTLIGFVTTAAANRAFQFGLASGDTGVRSIQSFNNVATSTSGTFGLILRRPIAQLSSVVNASSDLLGPIDGGLPRIYDDACLEFLWFANTSTAMTIGGHLGFAQG